MGLCTLGISIADKISSSESGISWTSIGTWVSHLKINVCQVNMGYLAIYIITLILALNYTTTKFKYRKFNTNLFIVGISSSESDIQCMIEGFLTNFLLFLGFVFFDKLD